MLKNPNKTSQTRKDKIDNRPCLKKNPLVAARFSSLFSETRIVRMPVSSAVMLKCQRRTGFHCDDSLDPSAHGAIIMNEPPAGFSEVLRVQE
eukprot:5891216-Amphidinium_carterae.1